MPDSFQGIPTFVIVGNLLMAIIWFASKKIIGVFESRLFSVSIQNAYRKYYKDYLYTTGWQLLSTMIVLIVLVIGYWWYRGVYLALPHLIFTSYSIVFYYYIAPNPLKKFFPILKDLRGNSFEPYRGTVKSYSKKRYFGIGALDRFNMSLALEGSENEVAFAGFANDLKEDYLSGDLVEVVALPTAKVILNVSRINYPVLTE